MNIWRLKIETPKYKLKLYIRKVHTPLISQKERLYMLSPVSKIVITRTFKIFDKQHRKSTYAIMHLALVNIIQCVCLNSLKNTVSYIFIFKIFAVYIGQIAKP